jgi:hypothetical protein
MGRGGELSADNVILPKTVGEFKVTKELPDNVVENRMRRTRGLFAANKNFFIALKFNSGLLADVITELRY